MLCQRIIQKIPGRVTDDEIRPPVTYQRAGWTGLRYGTVLGLGLGLICWSAFVWSLRIDHTLLATILWWLFWRDKGGAANVGARFADDDLMDDFGIRSMLFGSMLGFGLAIVMGIAVSFGWTIERAGMLSIAWILLWCTIGGGLKWEHDVGDQNSRTGHFGDRVGRRQEDDPYGDDQQLDPQLQLLRNHPIGNRTYRLIWVKVGGLPSTGYRYLYLAAKTVVLLPWHAAIWILGKLRRLVGLLWYLFTLLRGADAFFSAELQETADDTADDTATDTATETPVPPAAQEDRATPRRSRGRPRRQQQEEEVGPNSQLGD